MVAPAVPHRSILLLRSAVLVGAPIAEPMLELAAPEERAALGQLLCDYLEERARVARQPRLPSRAAAALVPSAHSAVPVPQRQTSAMQPHRIPALAAVATATEQILAAMVAVALANITNCSSAHPLQPTPIRSARLAQQDRVPAAQRAARDELSSRNTITK